MERFFDSDPEERYDFEDDGFDDEDVEFIGYGEEDILDAMRLDLAQLELNQHLLAAAITVAERSFFWRFKSVDRKMDDIQKIYRTFLLLTEDEGKEE